MWAFDRNEIFHDFSSLRHATTPDLFPVGGVWEKGYGTRGRLFSPCISWVRFLVCTKCDGFWEIFWTLRDVRVVEMGIWKDGI